MIGLATADRLAPHGSGAARGILSTLFGLKGRESNSGARLGADGLGVVTRESAELLAGERWIAIAVLMICRCEGERRDEEVSYADCIS